MQPIRFITSRLLDRAGFRHAFFTRNGGVSEGPYRSLNFSYVVGDEPANVDRNLQLAAQDLELPSHRLYFPAQVHEADVVEVGAEDEQRDVLFRRADAVVSGSARVACAVRTADCLPILMADCATGRVVAAHAGWRGLERRVIAAAARRLGGHSADWVAAVGPHITLSAFEVSDEVAERLERCAHGEPCVDSSFGAKPHVDLSRVAQAQLRNLGLPQSAIEVVPGCTVGEPERFFSYRRDGKQSGRMLSAIVPRGE